MKGQNFQQAKQGVNILSRKVFKRRSSKQLQNTDTNTCNSLTESHAQVLCQYFFLLEDAGISSVSVALLIHV